MSNLDQELWEIKRRAGNAGSYRLDEQFEDDDNTPSSLEEFIQNYYKNSELDIDEAMGVIRVSVPAERSPVDVGDMRKSEAYMVNVIEKFKQETGQPIKGKPQFIGIEANDQFSVNLVFQVTERPINFGS
jgi:hypothetical protein